MSKGALLPRFHRTLLPAVMLLFASGVALVRAQPAAPQKAETEWWKGVAEVPGMTLDFVVVFRPAGESGQYTATIDIPLQMAKDLALADVVLSTTEIRFTLPAPANAIFETRRAADGKTATGELKQHGMTFPVRMERITEEEAKTVGPPRPQTPKQPFPYQQREVTYENPVDKTKLAGTLTIPEGARPHPAVLLITGSGAQDRDETIFGHRPFFVIADHLTRHGIAVLRVDDRGVGGSSGSLAEAKLKESANDVLAGVDFLKQQPEIDGRRIALLGHSEGGVIAPLVASRSKDVACIVLLAGAGLPGDEILVLQKKVGMRVGGVSEDDVSRRSEAQRVVVERITAEAGEEAVRAAVRELLRMESAGATPEQIEEAATAVVKQWYTARMRSYLRHDPREALRKVKCPVLALIGSLDLQVPARENLPEIEKSLHAAGNQDATVKELPGLNHLFQEAKTGLLHEYATIQQTIAPAVLDELTNWLRKQFKLGP